MTPASVDAPKPKRLLFVCLGNICRSPAAHAVMEAMVAEAGLNDQIEVDSCGVGDWHVGQLPDSRMRRHGARRGYRVDHHARQFSAADFDRFDYIIVMDEGNYRAISAKARTQAQADRILRILAALDRPTAGGDRDFELALDLIEQGCRRLLSQLQRQL